MNYKTKFRYIIGMVLASLIVVLPILPSCASSKSGDKPIITTYTGLKSAIHTAEDGDVIYVGDIDFTPPGSSFNSLMRIKINKNITVKNGKKGEKAVFTNGSFILSGGKSSGDGTAVVFQDVIFDGNVNKDGLALSDFDCLINENGVQNAEPPMAQHALVFEGNVNANFGNCVFQNYMHEYGPIMYVRYGDYTSNPHLSELFADYSSCVLNIRFSHCSINNNDAGYGGGAIYIQGNDNVTLTAEDCEFANNRCSGHEYSMGGGAIFVNGAKLVLNRCRIENNIANFVYADMDPALAESDETKGGGLYVDNANINIKDSIIAGNTASLGGGIAFTDAEARIEGCDFTANHAQTEVKNIDGDTGPWINMAQGGAVYHEGVKGLRTLIINSSIYNNSAKTAYGGVYSHYTGYHEEALVGYLDLAFCNYFDNSCDSTYDYSTCDIADPESPLWKSLPGNVWEIPYISAAGCVIVDKSFEKDFNKYQLPTADNGYNYFAHLGQAEADGVRFVNEKQSNRLAVELPKTLNFSMPDEFYDKISDRSLAVNSRKYHIGSNHKPSLDNVGEKSNQIVAYVVLGCFVGLIAVIAILLIRKKKQGFIGDLSANNGELSVNIKTDTAESMTDEIAATTVICDSNSGGKTTNSEVENITASDVAATDNSTEKTIVKAWFTVKEIDTIFKSYPRIQTLTSRETEVLREMLEGKKQKEIAYDLGIEITTVKDFYRKIYFKLDFANKDELLRKFSEITSK